MASVEELIGNLLLRHNCVIVPSFGGFVAKRIPASIDLEKGLMQAPGKALLFNRQLINNDGLLIAEYATQNSVDYGVASTIISNLVISWNEKLKSGTRVTIDRVGFLYFDQEKNICFEQDRFFNLLLESYGLGKVHFMPVEDAPVRIHKVEKEEEDVISLIEHKHHENKNRSYTWKHLAAACFLPIAFYSYWIPAKTNVLQSGMISSKDFNPFMSSNAGLYKAKPRHLEIEPIKKPDFDSKLIAKENGSLLYEFDHSLQFPIEKQQTEVLNLSKHLTQKNQPFQLIVGCFSSSYNVENMIKQLHSLGINGYIFDFSNGLNRVSAGGASSDLDLRNQQNELSAKGIDCWILSRN